MRKPVFFKVRHLIPFSIFISFIYEGIKVLRILEAIYLTSLKNVLDF